MRILLLTLLFASSVTHSQTFHKCVGPDGVVTFSDVACPKHKMQRYLKAESVEVKTKQDSSTAPQSYQSASPVLKHQPTSPEISNSKPIAKQW